jgi:hypothetical protein
VVSIQLQSGDILMRDIEESDRVSSLEKKFKKFTIITVRAIIFLGLVAMASLILSIVKQ